MRSSPMWTTSSKLHCFQPRNGVFLSRAQIGVDLAFYKAYNSKVQEERDHGETD